MLVGYVKDAMRKYLVGIWLLFITIAAGTIFWYADEQYSTLASVPKSYTIVRGGKLIQLTTRSVPVRVLCGFNPDAKKAPQ